MAPLVSNVMNPYKREKQLYLLLIILVLLAGGVFGSMKALALMDVNHNTATMETQIAGLQRDAVPAQQAVEEASKALEGAESAFAKISFDILPESEQYIELTKVLDDFFEKNFENGSSIVASNLRFGASQKDPAKPYSVLPLSLTITSSREKFATFLASIQQSGSFEKKDRLLDLQAIKINFGGDETKDEISYTVDLRAFFRNPTPHN